MAARLSDRPHDGHDKNGKQKELADRLQTLHHRRSFRCCGPRTALVWFLRVMAITFNIVIATVLWRVVGDLLNAGFSSTFNNQPVVLRAAMITIVVLGPVCNVMAIFWPRR